MAMIYEETLAEKLKRIWQSREEIKTKVKQTLGNLWADTLHSYRKFKDEYWNKEV